MTAVPLAAVLNSKQGTFVYVLDKANKVSRRSVTLGPVMGNWQFVSKGLKPGESVISGGTNKAFPGMTVNPVWAGK